MTTEQIPPYKNKEHINRLKSYAKYHFKNCELLPFGFAIDLITINIERDGMHICDFNSDGKCFETKVPIPDTGIDMLQYMKNHCGVEKVNRRLINNISII